MMVIEKTIKTVVFFQNGVWAHSIGDLSPDRTKPAQKKGCGDCNFSRNILKPDFLTANNSPTPTAFSPKKLNSFQTDEYTQNPCLKSLPLRLVRMLSFCYRQIFVRRPFRSGRVCAFFVRGNL